MRLLIFTLALLLCGTAAGQSDEQQTRAKLEQLKRDITSISTQLEGEKSRRNKLRQELRKAEVLLGEIEGNIRSKREKIDGEQAKLKRLEQQQLALQQARAEQQTRITQELRAAWEMGNQGQLKVLLNQQDPHTVARMLAYYRYFFSARNELITQYRGTLDELAQVQTNIENTTAALQADIESLDVQLQELAAAQQSRTEAVAKLNASISSNAQRLQQMQNDQTKLEQLLQAIEAAVIDLELPESSQPFAAAKGKMPWPVSGKASNRYGRSRNAGNMRWQGLQIPARAGTSVEAIHHGRVVYADWFRGSGLLLIVDHGDGYMSLYAHNQTLLKEVGQWVSAGTPIATVGTSGGLTQPALYFEIRKNGKPTNPGSWLR